VNIFVALYFASLVSKVVEKNFFETLYA